jgi:hypothetical protein
MRPQLEALKAKRDLTESEFLALLGERDLAREEGREADYAECLLLLAHFVKWVRSDNDEPPFVRATTLSLEALPIYERLGDTKGQISALLSAVPGVPPEKATAFLATAMDLAKESGDELQVAKVLNRQAARAGMSDRNLASQLNREALIIYERHGDRSGQAACQYSLIMTSGDDYVARVAALSGADLYESVGDPKMASKCLSLALHFHAKSLTLDTQLKLAERGLKLAQQTTWRSLEGSFYRDLSRIHQEMGNPEESAQYNRWHKEIQDSDGLTEKQRSRNNKRFAKQMSAFAKLTGHLNAAKMFRECEKTPPENS